MNTAAGTKYDPMHPAPDVLTSNDIAHALAHIMRWGGHFIQFRSVAEHSLEVLAFALADNQNLSLTGQLYALLHDAGEAALGSDLPAPVKEFFPVYRKLETYWLKVILEQYGVDYDQLDPEEIRKIKIADQRSTELERSFMLNPESCSLPLYSPELAKKMFKAKLAVLAQRLRVGV